MFFIFLLSRFIARVVDAVYLGVRGSDSDPDSPVDSGRFYDPIFFGEPVDTGVDPRRGNVFRKVSKDFERGAVRMISDIGEDRLLSPAGTLFFIRSEFVGE